MPYRQYFIGHISYLEHYNFPVYIITHLMFFVFMFIMYCACIMSIQHIYL